MNRAGQKLGSRDRAITGAEELALQFLLPLDTLGKKQGIPLPPVQKGKLRPRAHSKLAWPGSQQSCLCCQLAVHPWTQFPHLYMRRQDDLTPWE